MKVSELAKELNTTSKEILTRLKNLKLKAKDSNQELNSVVLSVLRNEFSKSGTPKAVSTTAKPVVKKETTKKKKETKAEKSKKKTVVKKKDEKPDTTKKKSSATTKKTTKKTVAKKKKTVVQDQEKRKSRIQISDEPFVTVKPLAKKKRKSTVDSKSPAPPTSEHTKPVPEIPDVTASDSNAIADKAPVEDHIQKDLQSLELPIPIAVKDLAVKLEQKSGVILKKLMGMGVFAHINQGLDEGIVQKILGEFGFSLKKAKTEEEQLIDFHQEEEDPKLLQLRAPVVTLMGHVDHGKTSLLDCIRKSRVADKEHGAITQHMGAYSVELPKGRITFLDTPGHEAFTSMRARGAHITDVVILVVAADEGVMPQTEEALDHARAANVPIVVALTKIDKRNADIDRVKKQLSEYDLTPEDWGGKTIVVGVSSMTGEGVAQLLEMMLLEAELLELKANPNRKASGIVIEAHLSPGKGSVSTLIVQNGTLKEGDVILAGSYDGRIKAMFDDYQRPIQAAGPSMPVEILGLPGVPEAGEVFYAVDNEKQAKEIVQKRKEHIKNQKLLSTNRLSLEDLYSQIQEGKIKELNVIIKSDVQGSLEALKDSLAKIPNDQVQLKFIHTAVGDIKASDVILAAASNAVIMGFNVETGPRAKAELEKHNVDVRHYRIIYDAVNDIKNALEGLLEPKTRKKFMARIEIRNVFKLSKSGVVAGCFVTKGKVSRKAHIDILRNGESVHSGVIGSLKRFKDDVREVGEGFECGITIDGFDRYEAGDIIEAYELEQIARKL